MATRNEVEDARLKVHKALYDAIAAQVPKGAEAAPGVRAGVLKELALAYRLVAGGPQPGAGVVESK